MPPDREAIWDRALRLIDRAPTPDALRAHRVDLLAAHLWRAHGREVPEGLRVAERRAARITIASRTVLTRARAAYDGRLMLMKGPEAAAHYPDSGARFYRDVDLLADDPEDAQRALLAAGFIELETDRDYAVAQHLRPLAHPGLPLIVELHRRPNVPPYLSVPATAELLATGVPSATGIDGLLAPAPAAHALLLSAHAWAHHPLGCLGDMIDVAAVLPAADRPAARALAVRWGWDRMWRVTLSTADALFAGGIKPLVLRTWARHLRDVRELSVLENHVTGVAAPVCALPPRELAKGIGAGLRDTVGRSQGESWTPKLQRAALALIHAFQDRSVHDRRAGLNPWHR